MCRRHWSPRPSMMRDDPDAEPAIGVAYGTVGLDLFIGELPSLQRGGDPRILETFGDEIVFVRKSINVTISLSEPTLSPRFPTCALC